MKVCPNCQQRYDDDNLNFCLNDGGVLTKVQDDAAPTVLINQVRTTDQNWSYTEPAAQPMTQWQGQPPPMQQGQQNPQLMNRQWTKHRDQTLPILSLVLGVLSLPFTCWCGGFYFGVAALITGYIGMNNAKNNPDSYTGKEMAIAGLVLGAFSFVITVIIVLIAIAKNI
jgi:hypothetical protein